MPDTSISNVLLRLTRRAEVADRTKLVETFVDIGPLFSVLSSTDHQVVYGRRGTGKTHALLFLAETVRQKGDIPIYLDMRTIGSTGGIYADAKLSLPERATRLLMDSLAALHEGVLERAVTDGSVDLSAVGPQLDALAQASTEVQVVGDIALDQISRDLDAGKNSSDGIIEFGRSPTLKVSSLAENKRESELTKRMHSSGQLRHRVHFGAVGSALRTLLDSLAPRRLWLLLDEWSAVPLDLQPYLADLLRRAVFPSPCATVKVGAIEQRSRFQIAATPGDYIGIELGSDASADVNLDDFMVFDNDAQRAMLFFQQLLFKHYRGALNPDELAAGPQSARDLIRDAFTQTYAFEEFVRAAEGVPRDAINLLSLAAQKAYGESLSVPIIRGAAKAWYQRDKEAAASANEEARHLLHWIIDEVIGRRKARAFLLRADVRHELIDALFDARVIHLAKRGISTHDQPGVRYDVYRIDYGCYVDLLTTAKAPLGLLPAETEEGGEIFIDVPPDDYRAIRRAILDLELIGSP